MSRILFVCAALFLLACVESSAQRDSVSHSFVPVSTVSSPFLKYKWFAAELPKAGLSPYRNYAISSDPLHISNLHLRTDWSDELFFLSDYRPYASQEEYNALLRNGLGFTYDPMNPDGVNYATGDLLSGSINFLLMLVSPCK